MSDTDRTVEPTVMLAESDVFAKSRGEALKIAKQAARDRGFTVLGVERAPYSIGLRRWRVLLIVVRTMSETVSVETTPMEDVR